MPGLVEEMLRTFATRQDRFFMRLSREAKKKFRELENKYAVLTVTGPEGGTFYIQYKANHVQPLDGPPDIPYDELDKFLLDGDMLNYEGGDDVFFDVVDGDLSPRAVISHRYLRANTNKVIYDTEEFASAFENFLEDMRRVIKK